MSYNQEIKNFVSNNTKHLLNDSSTNAARLKKDYLMLCDRLGQVPEEWDGKVYQQSMTLGKELDEALSKELFYDQKIKDLKTD